MTGARSRAEPRWVRIADGVVEAALVSFAAFTCLHLVAALAGWPAPPVGYAALALTAVVGLVVVNRAWVVPPDPDPPPGPGPGTAPAAPLPPAPPVPWPVVGAAVVAAALATLLAWHGPSPWFRVFWVVALLAALATASWCLVPGLPRRLPSPPPSPAWEHRVAVLLCLGLAVLMLFVLNQTADDVYYVNRSEWVAEHGTFPRRDTMFGPETFPSSYADDLPVVSLEGLFGVVALLLGVRAGTVTYLLANPVLVALGAWATWRLVCAWAPRSRVLVFLVALAVPLFSATGLVGDFAWARIWQGKVVAVVVLGPLVWTYLTRLASEGTGLRAQRWAVGMLAVAGVAWCGLTVTAPMLAPVPAVAAALAALALPAVRVPLLAGAAALAAAPLATGAATLVVSPDGVVAEARFSDSPGQVWREAMGLDPAVVGLLVLGLLLGPVLVRAGGARTLAAVAAVGTVVLLAPGLQQIVHAATGAGPIFPRTLLAAPVPVLVGMLAAVPVAGLSGRTRPVADRAREYAGGAGVALVLLVALVAGGTAVWSPAVDAHLTARPTWKVLPEPLANARAVVERDPGPGPVLLPGTEMRALAVASTTVFGVVPRSFYTPFLEEDPEQADHRRVLRFFVDPRFRSPTAPRVGKALRALDVSLACARADTPKAVRKLRRTHLGDRVEVGSMVCFEPPFTGRAVTLDRKGRA